MKPVSWGSGLTPDELAERIKQHPFAAVREPLMTKVTLVALRQSQPRTPVDTGTLRRSETNRVEPGGLRGYIGSNIVYAPFVHARTPFFQEGIAASKPEIMQLLEQMGNDYLGSIVK